MNLMKDLVNNMQTFNLFECFEPPFSFVAFLEV